MTKLSLILTFLLTLTASVQAAGWDWFVKNTRSGPYCTGEPTTSYGDGSHNADGSRFHPGGLSAAVPRGRYPFGTKLHITNCWNGRSVIVTVKDTGPGRYQQSLGIRLDISDGAADVLRLAASKHNTMKAERLGRRVESGWTSVSVVSMGAGETFHAKLRQKSIKTDRTTEMANLRDP